MIELLLVVNNCIQLLCTTDEPTQTHNQYIYSHAYSFINLMSSTVTVRQFLRRHSATISQFTRVIARSSSIYWIDHFIIIIATTTTITTTITTTTIMDFAQNKNT